MRAKLRTVLAVLWLGVAAARGDVVVRGQVTDTNKAPVAGARVRLEAEGRRVEPVVTGVRGEFSFTLDGPARVRIRVEREGFYPLEQTSAEVGENGLDLALTLERAREVVESLEVTANPHALDLESTGVQQTASNTDIVNAPYPNTNDLRSALRIVPGVVRDSRGAVHVHGAGEDQVMYTLNGFNLSDPISGRFESRFSIESVQSVEIATGSLAAEYGKGSGGTMAIRTISGDDRLRFSATNFVPGFENRKGIILGDWTPRAGVTGPIARGRAWFSDSVDIQYTKTVIQDLPKGEDRTASMRWSNLLHTQYNLRPGNILYSSFLATHWNAPRTGLSALTPIETTTDRRSRQLFFSVKDQAYLAGRAVLEFGYAANRTYGREIPQGSELLAYRADGRTGNAFLDAERHAARDQVVVNGFLPSFALAGSHQVKGGFDLNRVRYEQSVRRTGYDRYSEDGWLRRRTLFAGNGDFNRGNREVAMYVQDSWRARPGLVLDAGLRADWDNALRRWSVSPRAGMAWSPPGLDNTKLSAGFARIFDATNLRVICRPFDQYSLTTFFRPDGSVEREPALTVFSNADTRPARPRYNNWNAGVEQRIGTSISLRADYLRRRGAGGFSYGNLLDVGPPPPEFVAQFEPPRFDGIFALSNSRVDKYDAATLSFRHHIGRQYEWMMSYTASRAISNAVIDLSIDDALIVPDNTGRMAWDAPHRFLSWGYLPTFRKNWAVAYLADWRSGFPFSLQNEEGHVVGRVSAYRFPKFFEANLHLERQFVFRNHRWAFRFGFNNITNRRNPDVVNNLVSSPQALQFFGGVGRSGNFRIRWLGRA